jgi:hypothetical protein
MKPATESVAHVSNIYSPSLSPRPCPSPSPRLSSSLRPSGLGLRLGLRLGLVVAGFVKYPDSLQAIFLLLIRAVRLVVTTRQK